MFEFLQLIVGLLIIFFLPGFTLVRALFPRKGDLDKEFNFLYELVYGIGLSIVITILVGFVLGTWPKEPNAAKGYFTATNILLSLSTLTIIFFFIGWYRGAYPFTGKLHPKLWRPPPLEPSPLKQKFEDEKQTLTELHSLAKERQKLKWELKDCDRKIRLQTGSMKRYYEDRREKVITQLNEINQKIKELEKKRSSELY